MGKNKRHKDDDSKPVRQEAGSKEGQIIQAGGDVHITQAKDEKEKGFPSVVNPWLGGVVAIVTILFTVQLIIKNCQGEAGSDASRFYGVVRYESGEPVADATIRIESTPDSGELLGEGKTTANGEFNIVVKTQPEMAVWVTITKNGELGFSEMTVLGGNQRLRFRGSP